MENLPLLQTAAQYVSVLEDGRVYTVKQYLQEVVATHTWKL